MVGDKVWIRQDSIPYTFDLLTELFYNQYGNRIPLVQVKDTLKGVLFNNLFSQLPELYALMEAQNSVMMSKIKDSGFGETYVQSGTDSISRTGKVTQSGDRVNINSTSDAQHAYDFNVDGTFRDSINSGRSNSDQDSNSNQTINYGKQTTKTTSRVFEYLSDAQIGGLIIKWLENFNPLFKTVLAQNAAQITPGLAEFIQLNFSWGYITGSPNDNGAFVSYMRDFRSYLESTYMSKFFIDSNAEYGLYWDRDSLNRPVLRATFSDKPIKDLTSRVTVVENAIINLERDVNTNISDIEILQSNVIDLESKDEDLQSQINSNTEQISENASNINQNKGEINTLRNDLGDLGNIQNQLITELKKLIDRVAQGNILHIDGPYNAEKTYSAGALVIGNDFLWLSLQDNNVGNPLVDDSAYWYKLFKSGDVSISLDDYYNKQAIDTMLTQYATVAALQALQGKIQQNETDITNLKNNKADTNFVNVTFAKLGGDNTFASGKRNIYHTLPEAYTQNTMPTKPVELTTKKYVDQKVDTQIQLTNGQKVSTFAAAAMQFTVNGSSYYLTKGNVSSKGPTDILLKGDGDQLYEKKGSSGGLKSYDTTFDVESTSREYSNSIDIQTAPADCKNAIKNHRFVYRLQYVSGNKNVGLVLTNVALASSEKFLILNGQVVGNGTVQLRIFVYYW